LPDYLVSYLVTHGNMTTRNRNKTYQVLI
jgi:hypothetical protein